MNQVTAFFLASILQQRTPTQMPFFLAIVDGSVAYIHLHRLCVWVCVWKSERGEKAQLRLCCCALCSVARSCRLCLVSVDRLALIARPSPKLRLFPQLTQKVPPAPLPSPLHPLPKSSAAPSLPPGCPFTTQRGPWFQKPGGPAQRRSFNVCHNNKGCLFRENFKHGQIDPWLPRHSHIVIAAIHKCVPLSDWLC